MSARGILSASVTTWCDEPNFCADRRDLGRSARPPATARTTWEASTTPMDSRSLSSLHRPAEQGGVDLFPNPGGLPFMQIRPAGHRAAATHLLGQVFPGDPRLEHKEDARKHLPVVQGLASYRKRRGFSGGKSGSITFHKSSSNKGFAIAAPPFLSLRSDKRKCCLQSFY